MPRMLLSSSCGRWPPQGRRPVLPLHDRLNLLYDVRMAFRHVVCLGKIAPEIVQFDLSCEHRFANSLPIASPNGLG